MSSIRNNFIIEFTPKGEGDRARLLEEQLRSKGEEVNYIWLDKNNLKALSDKERDFFKKITHTSRIYIIEHGLPNQKTIGKVHYQELAALLANNIQDNEVYKPSSQLKISFSTCFAAKGDEAGLRSFAGLFHRYLGQHHKIYSTVLARNQFVWTRGRKYTATQSQYAYLLAAEKLGKSKADLESEILQHQAPGTKALLRWDENGDEWIVDAYIDKYFSRTEKILKLLFIAKAKGELGLDWQRTEKLIQAKMKLADLTLDKGNETYLSVEIIDRELNEIKRILSDLKTEKSNEIVALIDANLQLSKASINEKSLTPVRSKANISDQPIASEANVEEQVANVGSPIIKLAGYLPGSDIGDAVKMSAIKLAAALSQAAKIKLRREHSDAFEITMSKISQHVLLNILDTGVSKEEKLETLEEMSREMFQALTTLAGLFPTLDGALDGIKAAYDVGGGLGFVQLAQIVSKRSTEKEEQFTKICQAADNFVSACEDYIQKM